MSNQLEVKSRIHDYRVLFYKDFSFLNQLGKTDPLSVIVDGNVFDCYSDLIRSAFGEDRFFLLQATEENKSLKMVSEIYEWLTQRPGKRNMTLISIGGGIVQDVTGFAASTLYRGIRWIYVPTTLLSQTDSCIGSKTSINLKKYKNLVGTFYPPMEIMINVKFRKTLPRQHYCSGVGEVIKFQLMNKAGLPSPEDLAGILRQSEDDDDALESLIIQNLGIKRSYMDNDEFDFGERNLLNYGHCFGHALETASNYEVPHGIAINIGIIFANLMAAERGLLDHSYVDELTAGVNIPNIQMELQESFFDTGRLLSAIKNDKKRRGELLPLVFLTRGGALIKVDDVSDEEFIDVLRKLIERLFD